MRKNKTVKDFQANIKKYEAQQNKVRNNREYDAITKEIEFQNLEIQLAEKRTKEAKASIVLKANYLIKVKLNLKNAAKILKLKKVSWKKLLLKLKKKKKN